MSAVPASKPESLTSIKARIRSRKSLADINIENLEDFIGSIFSDKLVVIKNEMESLKNDMIHVESKLDRVFENQQKIIAYIETKAKENSVFKNVDMNDSSCELFPNESIVLPNLANIGQLTKGTKCKNLPTVTVSRSAGYKQLLVDSVLTGLKKVNERINSVDIGLNKTLNRIDELKKWSGTVLSLLELNAISNDKVREGSSVVGVMRALSNSTRLITPAYLVDLLIGKSKQDTDCLYHFMKLLNMSNDEDYKAVIYEICRENDLLLTVQEREVIVQSDLMSVIVNEYNWFASFLFD
jgi:hypothetical protein